MYTFEADKLRKPISDAELERRWKLVRAAMEKEGIDALVIQNEQRYRNGMVRYFTDIGSLSNPVTVYFPKDEEMTVIANGGGHSLSQTPAYGCRGVKDRIGVPIFPTYVPELNSADAAEIVEIIKRRGDKKIGLVKIGTMLASFYKRLTESLAGVVEFVDFSEPIDEIRAIKSEEEIELMRLNAQIQDAVMLAIPSFLQPGMYEYQLRSRIVQLLMDLGSEEQLLMIGSAPKSSPAGHKAHFYQNRRIEIGDQIMVMLEPNGPGGMWVELGRTLIIGEPHKELIEVWDDAIKAQEYTASLLTPGAECADIFKKYNEFVVGMGYAEETRIHAHGQGYDLMERPGIRTEDPMIIRPNMNIAIHPTFSKNGAYAFASDNFLTVETGMPERLHKNPQTLIPVVCC